MSQVEKDIHEALERFLKKRRKIVEEASDNDPDQPHGFSKVTGTR